jgi:hypothetical protein
MSRLLQIRDPEAAHLPDRRTPSFLRGCLGPQGVKAASA